MLGGLGARASSGDVAPAGSSRVITNCRPRTKASTFGLGLYRIDLKTGLVGDGKPAARRRRAARPEMRIS